VQFLNPALLAGAALFAVPLVIHLLNRQRHKKRPWAAMEFLLRAYQKQRNRLRNENLLLLLLRCLIPIVLALAIARPVLQQAAALLGSGGGIHHVVVLDASYSMGARLAGGPSAYDKAKGLVSRLLERLEQQREVRDKVTLVHAGVRPRFLVRQDLDLEAAKTQALLLQRPEDGAGDLTEAMKQVAIALEQETDPEVRIYVLTDLQRRALGQDLGEGAKVANPGRGTPPGQEPPDPRSQAPGAAEPSFQDTLRDVCEGLQKQANLRLHWIDCGPFAEQRSGGTVDNVQITGLRQEMVAAIARIPTTLVVTLRNRGQTAASVPVTLDVDGQEPMRKVVRLDAGADGEAEFQVVFRETGRRRLRASIQNDGLEADDEWFTSLDVRDRIRVLLVDGAAEDDPLRSYYHLFGGLLDPEQGQGSPEVSLFGVVPVDTLALLGGKADPAAHDVTILADVDRLNETATSGLVRALQAGKGVLVLLGERSNQESYNLHLYGDGDGDGPMPFRLRGFAGGRAGAALAPTPSIALPEHRSLADFDEAVYREILQNIPVHRWHLLAPDSLRASPTDRWQTDQRPADRTSNDRPGDDRAAGATAPPAEVVLRITDAAQSPLLITARAGEGRFACLTSAPASEYRPERWNELHYPMAAYPLVHGLVKWLSLPAQDPFQAQVGAELGCTLPARPDDVHVLRPERDGAARVPLAEEARPLPGGRYALPPYGQTTFAGFYVYELLLDREAGKEPVSLPFAVNVDPDEGDLQYASAEECRQALGLQQVLTNLPAEQGAVAAGPERSEFGPLLLLCTLLFVLGEAAMARYVSMRRS
jgi:hypothetical protein